MKNTTTPAPGSLNTDGKNAGLNSFEAECTAKIKRNTQSIAQFLENRANIGPLLKAKFDKKVAELEQKNAALLLQIENNRAERKQQSVSV